MPKPSHPEFTKLFKKLEQIKDDLSFELKLAKKSGEFITVKELKERIEGKDKNTVLSTGPKKLYEFYDEIVKELNDQGRIGYADAFDSNKLFIKKCLGEKDKPFMSITEKDFKKIDSAIHLLKSESTKSNYLRTFYRLWNIAIQRRHCVEKHHPKFHISFKAYKRIKTKKRAIPLEYTLEIEKLDFP
jgi:hypothetical protein